MRGITFVSAHPKSPMRGCKEWSAGIIGLGELATTQKQGDITVVLGDLNSGTDHPSFRKLLNAGFKDAALCEAKGRHAIMAAMAAHHSRPCAFHQGIVRFRREFVLR